MNTRRRHLYQSIGAVLAGVLVAPAVAIAQAVVGPGTVNSTVTATSGTTTVVGNTTIDTGNNDGVRANGGDVLLDMNSPL
ncbi:MAG: hypothetical protein ACRCWE_03905, partial [Stenotrophomonas maltophilia]